MNNEEKIKIIDKMWKYDLTFKDKIKLFFINPNREHFGLGLYIRNVYLYQNKRIINKDLDFDELSYELLIMLYKKKYKRIY